MKYDIVSADWFDIPFETRGSYHGWNTPELQKRLDKEVPALLIKRVNEKLRQGWVPSGAPIRLSEFKMMQAIVKG